MVSLIVVDDDKDTVDTLVPLLETIGYEILGKGYNGKDAYDLYKKMKPDIVLIDMKMPVYDGNYGIKMIKKEYPDAEIIILSGFLEYRLKENKSIRFLHKPYNLKELLTTIKSAIKFKQEVSY